MKDLNINICFGEVEEEINVYKQASNSVNLRNLYVKIYEFQRILTKENIEWLRKIDKYRVCRVSLVRQNYDLREKLGIIIGKIYPSVYEDKNFKVSELIIWMHKFRSYINHYSRCRLDPYYIEIGGEG